MNDGVKHGMADSHGSHGVSTVKVAPANTFQREMDEIETNLPFHRLAVRHPDVLAGAYDTGFIARDPTTRQLAEEIMSGQTIEIESMTRRLAALRQRPAAGAAAEFPALGGTRGP